MKKIQFSLILFLLTIHFVQGQNPVLEAYIKEGIASNKAFKQRQLDYTRSLFALKEAKGLFFPDINLNARYSVAKGGRIIEFPVGDLLNPVYNTLNLLTMSNSFPEIENQEFTFYRPKEHETKLSLIQPIYSSDIINNVKIKKEFAEISKVDVDQYKRELIKEIKIAYYNYQKAFYLGNLVDSTLLLVKENLRVSTSLFNNDLVTKDAVYRSEAEVSSLDVEKAKAKGMLISAAAYFNFLLNKPLDSEIEIFSEEPSALLFGLEQFKEGALENREEMEIIRNSRELNNYKLGLQRGAATPDLFGSVDYGYQGAEYSFTKDDDFVLASLVLRWNLFQGMTNRNKIQQTKIEGEKLNEILSDTEMKIRMQVINSYYTSLASYEAISAAKKRVLSSKKGFYLVERKYSEGQSSLLEYIDARTNLTNAESNLIIANNEYFTNLAELEYAAANLDINNY